MNAMSNKKNKSSVTTVSCSSSSAYTAATGARLQPLPAGVTPPRNRNVTNSSHRRHGQHLHQHQHQLLHSQSHPNAHLQLHSLSQPPSPSAHHSPQNLGILSNGTSPHRCADKAFTSSYNSNATLKNSARSRSNMNGMAVAKAATSITSPPSLTDEDDILTPLQNQTHTANANHKHSSQVDNKVLFSDDDDQDDEEMISLEQQRLASQHQHQHPYSQHHAHTYHTPNHHHPHHHHQHNNASTSYGSAAIPKTPSASMGHVLTSTLRRTPGANAMHRSAVLRRTPGANAMHRSAKTNMAVVDRGVNRGTGGVPECGNAGGMVGSRNNKTVELESGTIIHDASVSVSGNGNGATITAGNGASVLGYGLTLSTPVGVPSSRARSKIKSHCENEENNHVTISEDHSGSGGSDGNSSTSSRSPKQADKTELRTPIVLNTNRTNVTNGTCLTDAANLSTNRKEQRPPLDPKAGGIGSSDVDRGRENYMYTPSVISLSKNSDLDMNFNGTRSPHTILLAENLDNLLDEDDGDLPSHRTGHGRQRSHEYLEQHDHVRGCKDTIERGLEYSSSCNDGGMTLTTEGSKNSRMKDDKEEKMVDFAERYDPEEKKGNREGPSFCDSFQTKQNGAIIGSAASASAVTSNLVVKSSSFSSSSPRRRGQIQNCQHQSKQQQQHQESMSPVTLHNSSFGADSHVSTLSNAFSHEDWSDVYTFDNNNNASLKVKTSNKKNDVKNNVCVGNSSNFTRNNKTNGNASGSNMTSSLTKGNSVSTVNADNNGSKDGPFRPKPMHSSFHRYNRGSSFDSNAESATTSDELSSNDKAEPSRPLNFNHYPPGGGAFAPPSKNGPVTPGHRQRTFQPQGPGGSSFYTPMPKKARDNAATVAGNHHNQRTNYPSGFDEYNRGTEHGGDTSNQSIVIHHHHHYNGMPPTHPNSSTMYDGGARTSGYHYDPNMYHHHSEQYPRPPSIHPPVNHTSDQYQHHHSVMMGNQPMDFGGGHHHHHLQPHISHPSISPATIPPTAMSPLTVPPFPLQHGTGMNFPPSLSPVSFAPPPSQMAAPNCWSGQHPANLNPNHHGGATNPDVLNNQRDSQWQSMGDVGWDQQQQQQQQPPAPIPSEYGFANDMFSGRVGNIAQLHMSTPTPPPFSPVPPSWLSSDYGDYSSMGMAADPSVMENMAYHASSNQLNFPQDPPPHIVSPLSEFQHHHQQDCLYHGSVHSEQAHLVAEATRISPHDGKDNFEQLQASTGNHNAPLQENGNENQRKVSRKGNKSQQQRNEEIGKSHLQGQEKGSRNKLSKKELKRQQKAAKVKGNSNRYGVESNSNVDFSVQLKKEQSTPFHSDDNIPQSKKKQLVDNYSKKKIKEYQKASLTDNEHNGKMQMQQTPDQRQPNEEATQVKQLSLEEEAAELKRTELAESPFTRSAFKDFQRKFRLKEKTSLKFAADFARECLTDDSFPTKIHWRIYLELADLSKRANKFDEARCLYGKVCDLQPFASQGWLEYSKLEEESGDLKKCSRILHKGLSFCEYNENLLTRAIKHEERIAHEERNGDLSRARQLLARLKHVGIEKVWRTVLEGAMLEARAGKTIIARRVLKYLMHWVPWYGPLYLEAYRLERDSGRQIEALAIVERGLKENPRYGPLWFGAFRLCEGLDLSENDLHLPRTMEMIERATGFISRELLWKVHLEAAQAQERASHLMKNKKKSLNECLSLSRKSFAKTVLACPENLCWKVWLAAGRMELSAGLPKAARNLFLKAFAVVPGKGRPAVLLECARLEEFIGNVNLARAILCKARNEAGSDWKVWLESVSLEMRNKNRNRAINLAQNALLVHSGTGRLWAALVQLRQPDGEDLQMNALKKALAAVPKSGEVWCEAARLFLNPFSPIFDLVTASQHLNFATKFTPQYGDSFLETLRLELLQKWIVPIGNHFFQEMVRRIEDLNVLPEQDFFTVLYSLVGCCVRNAVCTLKHIERKSNVDMTENMTENASIINLIANLNFDFANSIDTNELELRCCNADPNYGKLWFHCRLQPTDTARTVLARAKHVIGRDLVNHAHIYIAALLRRNGIKIGFERINSDEISGTELSEKDKSQLQVERNREQEKQLNCLLRSAPTLSNMLKGIQDDASSQDMLLLESNISGADFVTGLVEINSSDALESLSLIERRKILFGSDLLLSWKPA